MKIFYGGRGTGKTALMVAMWRRMLQSGPALLLTTDHPRARHLIREFKMTEEEATCVRVASRGQVPPLLGLSSKTKVVVDDVDLVLAAVIGRVPDVVAAAAEVHDINQDLLDEYAGVTRCE